MWPLSDVLCHDSHWEEIQHTVNLEAVRTNSCHNAPQHIEVNMIEGRQQSAAPLGVSILKHHSEVDMQTQSLTDSTTFLLTSCSLLRLYLYITLYKNHCPAWRNTMVVIFWCYATLPTHPSVDAHIQNNTHKTQSIHGYLPRLHNSHRLRKGK